MLTKVGITIPFVFMLNCFSFGRAGYIVPHSDDSADLEKEIIAEKCDFVVTQIGHDLNREIKKTGKSTYENVGILFTGGNCAQLKKIKGSL